jgi:hypothetical protein
MKPPVLIGAQIWKGPVVIALLLVLASGVDAYRKRGSTGKIIQSDGSQADVQRAIDAASDGSTVTIPAGTFNWSGQLTIRKAVSVAGASKDSTVIRNDNGASSMILAQSGKNGNIQIYGLDIVQVADNGAGRGFMISASRNTSSRNTVLIHDCKLDQNGVFSYSVDCGSNGIIIWGCDFIAGKGMGGVTMVCGWDYESYNQPSTLGTKDTDGLHNIYIEDCTFLNGSLAITNFDSNSRMVFRHNFCQDSGLNSHGQESSPTGTVSFEIYDNTFKITKDNPRNMGYWVCVRGGTGVVTDNRMDEVPWGADQIQLNVFSIGCGINDGHGGILCPIQYPAPRQTGWAWADNQANWGKVKGNPQLLEGGRSPGYFLANGKGAVCDPVYVWGNTGPGTQAPYYVAARNTYSPDVCGNGLKISQFLQKGRDFIVDQGPKPGYTKYPYPHPLRSGQGGGQPSPTPTPQPTLTPEPTATPTPQPTPSPSPARYHQRIDAHSDSPIDITVTPVH